MEHDMSPTELSAFLDSCVPPHEKFAEHAGKPIKFQNQYTRQQFGNKWLHGTLHYLMSDVAVISGVPYSYNGMMIEKPFG